MSFLEVKITECDINGEKIEGGFSNSYELDPLYYDIRFDPQTNENSFSIIRELTEETAKIPSSIINIYSDAMKNINFYGQENKTKAILGIYLGGNLLYKEFVTDSIFYAIVTPNGLADGVLKTESLTFRG